MSDFVSLGIGETLAARLRGQGIAAPVSVQIEAIPNILEGRDAVVESATGTGKTLAYLLPVLQRLERLAEEERGVQAPQALVIAPTQELSMQIVRVAESLTDSVKIAACIGGASIQRQIERLRVRPALVVGTPGRLAELYKLRKLKLHRIECVVIDEVDQLLALGGEAELESLLRAMPRERQLLFVTATVTDAARGRAAAWMRDPVTIGGGSTGAAAAPVRHQFMICERRDKIDLARRLIRTLHPRAALLFVNGVDAIGELEAKLAYAGLLVKSLYGEAGKRERAEVMRRFAAGGLRLIIATDIAARGLDVPGITHIINIDPPPDAERYVHRAGRTGRMGRGGTVITLATAAEFPAVRRISGKLGLTLEEMTLSHGRWTEVRSEPVSRGTLPHAGAAGNPGPRKPDVSPAKSPKDRHRDRKNKGAPRWLKDKK